MDKKIFLSFLIIISLTCVCCEPNDLVFRYDKEPTFVANRGYSFLLFNKVPPKKNRHENRIEFEGFAVENPTINNNWDLGFSISNDLPSVWFIFDNEDYFIQIGKELCYTTAFEHWSRKDNYPKYNSSYYMSVNLSKSPDYKQDNPLDMGYFHFRLPKVEMSSDLRSLLMVVPEHINVNIFIEGEVLCSIIDLFPNDYYTPFFVMYGYSVEEYCWLFDNLNGSNWIDANSSKLLDITFNIFPEYPCNSISREEIRNSWCEDHYTVKFVVGENMMPLKWSFYDKDESHIENVPEYSPSTQ